MSRAAKIFIACLFLCPIAAPAESGTLSVDFSTPATPANIGAIYSDWAFIVANGSDNATVSVESGQLRLSGNQSDPTKFQLLTAPVGAFTIDLSLGAFPGNSSVNIGVMIGQNEIVFHPGHPGTAVRVEGPGGFDNQDTGFTLASEVLHHFRLTGDGLGLFTILLTDAQNASNSYTRQFTNAGSIGGLFSITRAGVFGTSAEVRADNFVLTDEAVASVPDSSETLTLALIGLLGIVVGHRFQSRRSTQVH